MKAIQVKYIGPTNTKPSRLKATAEGVAPLVMAYSHASDYTPHATAAIALAKRMGWTGTLVSGGLADGSEVFCFADSARFDI